MAQMYDTKLEVHKVNYLWVIHDYDFHKAMLNKGQSLKSPIFHASKDPRCKWFLDLYPKGKDGTGSGGASLYLSLDSTSEYTEAFGKYEFGILSESQLFATKVGSGGIRKFVVKSSTNGGCSWGFHNFTQLSNKKFTIKCELTFKPAVSIAQPFNQSNSIKPQSNVSNFFLNEDLRKLFVTQEFTDVTIYVKNKEYRAHKLILKARSPVFAAMFKYEDMEENQKSKVVITDLNELVVEEMLNYIYTDRLENLGKLADGLLAAAEKYGLDGLKELSQDVLIARLSVENAIDTLILADLYRASKMKSCTVTYIIEKSAVLMKTTAWKNLSLTHPHLVVEVCDAIANELHGCAKKSPVGKNGKFLWFF